MTKPGHNLVFQLADAGDSTAIIDSDRGIEVTYAALRAHIEERKEMLAPSAGAVCLIGLRNSFPSLVTLLALIESGCSAMLASPATPSSQISTWIGAYRPEVVLGFNEWKDELRKGNGKPRAESIMLPTSGSTGNPKFVRLSQSNLAANAHQIVKGLSIAPSHRALAHLPLFYSYGLSVVTSHLVAGATVVLTEASTIERRFWEIMENQKITSLSGVPYSYQIFDRMKLIERSLPNLTDLTQAGGRMNSETVTRYAQNMFDRGGDFWLMYGQTEATARISIMPSKELFTRRPSVGLALEGSEVFSSAANKGDEGELIVTGPQVMLGYASSRDDIDGVDRLQGVLQTGDLGFVDDNGFITISGRLKRIGKIAGIRINLDDLESEFRKFGEVAVTSDDQKILVFLEPSAVNSRLTSRELESEVGLPPRSLSIIPVDSIPRLPSGKINYEFLRA